MADAGSWSTAATTLAGVAAGSLISYVAQTEHWVRDARRDVYAAFVASTREWLDALGHVATALSGGYSHEQQELHWAQVNRARSASLSALAQIQLVADDPVHARATSMVSPLQRTHDRLYGREAPDLPRVEEEYAAAREEFVGPARRSITRMFR